MTSLIGLILQAAIPLLNFFLSRSKKKAEMKQKMYDLVEKYNKEVLENVRIKKDYEELKKEQAKDRLRRHRGY